MFGLSVGNDRILKKMADSIKVPFGRVACVRSKEPFIIWGSISLTGSAKKLGGGERGNEAAQCNVW